jgi:hypothetical protein
VTPFADRALDRGLAGVLVAAIRHARPDWEAEPGADAVPISNDDVDAAVAWIAERAGHVLGDAGKIADVEARCRALLDDWDRRRKGLETGALSYTSNHDGLDPLLDSGVGSWGTWSAGWSLREVEPETNLLITLAAAEVTERPPWRFTTTAEPASDGEEAEEDVEPADEAGLLLSPKLLAADGEPSR